MNWNEYNIKFQTIWISVNCNWWKYNRKKIYVHGKNIGILSKVFVRFLQRINHTISSFILSGPRYLTQNFRDGVFFYAIWTMMTKPELEIKLRPQVFVCQKKIAKLCVHNAWVWVVQRCFSIFALKKVVGEQISWGRKVSSD